MASNDSTAVLAEILEPVARAFSRDVAEALANIRASKSAEERISELAEKCNQGLLTDEERSEYESYVNAVDLVSVLKAKAKLWLVRHSKS